MANNFVWVNATTLNGTLWDNGTLSSARPITQTGTLTISSGYDKYLNTQLNNTGTIEFQSGYIVDYNDNNIIGTLNNSGTFKKTTADTATIRVAFNNTGTVNVEAGTLVLSGGGVNSGTFNITSGKQLEINNSVYTFTNAARINGSGYFVISGGTLKANENLTLTSLTTYWFGGTFFSANIITNSGYLTISSGYDKYLNTQLNNTGTIEFQSGYIVDYNDNNIIGTLNNSGTFKKTTADTATIRVAFNNTGTVEANLGTLNFSNSYTHNNANLVLKGGTVTFSNALSINGGSIEGNGSISINVGVTNSGLLNPRYVSNTEFGRLTINGNYTETNSASINIQLGGSTAGTNFDQVDINGTATFDGTLNVSLLNNFTPTLGSTFDVLTYDSLNFLSNLNFTGLDINSTLQFVPQWFNNKLTLKVVNKSTATNINVTTNQDIVNASDGVLSLREAVIEANQNGLDNTIILGAQTYNLNFSGDADDNFAATGDLDILPRGGRVTIQGQGANQTFITATNLANLFQIHPGATINFSNVTVINPLLNDTVSVSKNVSLNLNVLNNDKLLKSQSIWLDDFQTTSVKGVTITRDNNGTFTDLSDDRLIYHPIAGFTGQDSFTYTITDGFVKEQATVTLNVVNDAPPAVNERLNTPMNTAITFAILTNNRDNNGDIINFESFQNTSTFGGTITKLNNQLTYTPRANFSGPDTFIYKINDGFVTTQSTVTVLVNAPPNAVVTTTQDTINYTDGLLSLREAIIQANNANIDSTITLGEGTYTLAINGANEDLAATGDLDIKLQNKTLTIRGQGKNKTILDANSLDRFFQVHSGATVILSGVTINKGLGSYGGALANNGTLTILDSDFINNQSVGARGANGANGANGRDSWVTYFAGYYGAGPVATPGENGKNGENGEDGKGGAIYNSGTLTISNSLIENNKVTGSQGGTGGNGGLGGVTRVQIDWYISYEYKPNGNPGSNGSNGNAYAGAIYNENTGSIFINAGQFANNLATPITGGTADNGDVNGIYNNGGTVTINNTVLPVLAIAPTNAVQTEGNSGYKAFTFTVTRLGATTGTNTVNWVVTGRGNNPANATDFGGTFPSGTVTFAANQTSKVITVNVRGDSTIEPDENFIVTLSNPTNGGVITTATATGTIQNDDTALAIAPTNAVQTEGNSGNKAFTFTVTRLGATTGTNTVNWVVTGRGTNPADATDFGGTFPSATLTFNPGETSKIITVNPQGDITQETSEQFKVTLSNPSNGATLTAATATGTIQNDDFIGNDTNNTLTGTANNDYIEGKGGNDTLNGGIGDDTLIGGLGDDNLNGGAGIDTLIGGIGNDIYVVDTITDTITENTNEGTDTIQSSVTFTITTLPNIENLTLTGTAAINGTGNTGNNLIIGNSANNILMAGLGDDNLNGGAGIDTLIGGLGNDIYVVDTTTDIISENVGEGTDTIQSSVTFTIATLPNIENLTLTGTAAIKGTGNDGNNLIIGNSANNILNGGLGKDNLNGGAGIDRFDYRNLADSVFSSFDVITEFNANVSNDLFLVSTARSGFSNAGIVTTLDPTAITAKLTTVNFGAKAAAQFSFGSRTFVAINDATAGFDSTTDAIIEVTGLTGTLGISNFTTALV
ncbi:beta strand repeat-containing protein [Dolichospermum flos-aquae]|uniref:Cadherin-like domain-containing protein n=1 Tax=Dolichospermum flos-aquae LEGE 04289 TaxID=1828708 RepID=A0ACC5Q476_DOLFA|nr:Ig-like domain-containing protein [Dolichospermum flos-aquae]MBE9218590.1 cadherin-like domain-containing protein [Dolichospermum flos-aquae LEGE 04289]